MISAVVAINSVSAVCFFSSLGQHRFFSLKPIILYEFSRCKVVRLNYKISIVAGGTLEPNISDEVLPKDYLETSPASCIRNTTNTIMIGIINKAIEASNRFIFKSEIFISCASFIIKVSLLQMIYISARSLTTIGLVKQTGDKHQRFDLFYTKIISI